MAARKMLANFLVHRIAWFWGCRLLGELCGGKWFRGDDTILSAYYVYVTRK